MSTMVSLTYKVHIKATDGLANKGQGISSNVLDLVHPEYSGLKHRNLSQVCNSKSNDYLLLYITVSLVCGKTYTAEHQ